MKEWLNLLNQNFDSLSPQIQEKVYNLFYNVVYKDVYYLIGEHSLTEDIIQEAFLKILTIIDKHEVTNHVAWIRRVTRNMTLDKLKKVNRERKVLEINEVYYLKDNFELAMQQISVANEVEDRIRDELLHLSILELKREYRELIMLFYVEDMTYKEIAILINSTEPAVSQKLARARKQLLYQFEKKWTDNNG